MLKELLKRIYKRKSWLDPTKNYSHWPEKLVARHHSGKILDVGAGVVRLGRSVITIDRYEKADIRADALYLPVREESIDLVLSVAVLEHLIEPYQAIKEMLRVLKKGGELYVEIPFLQPFHGSPDDYYWATLSGQKHWCRNFTGIDTSCVGPGSAVAWRDRVY